MRKGTVINLNGYKFIEFLAKNNTIIILVIFLITGLIIGTFGVKGIEALSNYSKTYLENFISDRTGASFLNIVANSFVSSISVIMIAYVLGSSMFGVVLVPLFITFRGVLCGGINAVLYSAYAVKGIAFNAVILIPSTIIFIIALLLASGESVKFSLKITKATLPKTVSTNLNADFKMYGCKYIMLCFVVLLSAIIDGVLSSSFLEYFKL